MISLSPDRLGLGALAAAIAVAGWAPASGAASPAATRAQDPVALRAGTVYLVEGDTVLTGGATILMADGKIQAVGQDIELPPNARLVDYGPDAVVVPGFVAAGGYSPMAGGPRTAEPELLAIEEFDFHRNFAHTLTGGVTSIYVAAAENRLIGGQGAVVKLAGKDAQARTLAAAAVLQGAIDSAARRAPGFWEPPIPATVDVGLGYQVKQLPKTTMGAILALEELLVEAGGSGSEDSPYGPEAGPGLAKVLEHGLSWRMAATSPAEIRALLSFGQSHGLHLIVDRAWGARSVAEDIAKAGADVIWRFPLRPVPGRGQDWGKDEDDRWPDYEVPAALEAAGVRFAIAPPTSRDVLFAASSALRGGLSEAAALRAVTLAPAEILGVADRVGSIKVGKDADLVVLNAAPLSGQASVQATWVGGEMAWEPTAPHLEHAAAQRVGGENRAVVLVVDELHVGDGEVLRKAEILMVDGKIREVGPRVSRPLGARVMHGGAAMPGIVDALGHLGLEGSRRAVAPDYSLSQIVAPGDRIDRRVAQAGVTTVVLTPRSTGRGGTPLMAYKPAAQDFEAQVIADPAAVRVNWTDRNRTKSGAELREIMEKAYAYQVAWEEYREEMKRWTPPAPKMEEDDSAEEDDGDEAEEDEKAEEENGKKKKKKKKKGEEEELEPDPVTGVWVAEVKPDEDAEAQRLRMRLHLIPEKGSGDMEGNLRCDLISESLVELEGAWDREAMSLSLMGLGSEGWVALVLTLEEGKLTGTCSSGGREVTLSCERSSKEWVVAKRTRRVTEEEKPKAPKGKPKEPRKDGRLEPFRQVIEGKASLLINLERADEILACLEVCEKYGVKPILVGARDAYKIADRLVGRVAGVILTQPIVVSDAKRGTSYRTPWAELQNAGLRVAFFSGAEEGAIDLPVLASYAVANGMSPQGALRALTADTADMFSIQDRVGRLRVGLDADVLLLDGTPLAPGTRVLAAFVNGQEVE